MDMQLLSETVEDLVIQMVAETDEGSDRVLLQCVGSGVMLRRAICYTLALLTDGADIKALVLTSVGMAAEWRRVAAAVSPLLMGQLMVCSRKSDLQLLRPGDHLVVDDTMPNQRLCETVLHSAQCCKSIWVLSASFHLLNAKRLKAMYTFLFGSNTDLLQKHKPPTFSATTPLFRRSMHKNWVMARYKEQMMSVMTALVDSAITANLVQSRPSIVPQEQLFD
jgi:hypothetical protein